MNSVPSASATTVRQSVVSDLAQLDSRHADYAVQFVNRLLASAQLSQASDIHLQPTRQGLAVSWRQDGMLHALGTFPSGSAADVVTRLKVLASLLTYRTEVPQEGRIRNHPLPDVQGTVDMRVSTFPTIHGERAVVRLFADAMQLDRIEQIGLPEAQAQKLRQLLTESTGAILITGPAGSGKTTTAYACLRAITQSQPGRNVVTLEDPVEVPLDGVSQSQVNTSADFTFATGLRSLLRQDPEVILVGEIRDLETTDIVLQASLTGQLVISTFHAGSAATTIARFQDMGIEPYRIRSGILAILSQRLVRRLCSCARSVTDESERLGLPVDNAKIAVGCEACGGAGYAGRMLLAELVDLSASTMGQAIANRADRSQLQEVISGSNVNTLSQQAVDAVRRGMTSPQEIRRVFGFGDGLWS